MDGRVPPKGINDAHPKNRTAGIEQRKKLLRGSRISVLAEDSEPLHLLVVATLQQTQPQVTFGRCCSWGGLSGIQLIERVAKILFSEFPLQQLGVEIQV